jgi:Low-density lipoprotein receptor repeat class B
VRTRQGLPDGALGGLRNERKRATFRTGLHGIVLAFAWGILLTASASADVYWSNYTNDTIGRANLDGTSVNQNFIVGASHPNGIAVDGGHLYWANQSSNSIAQSSVDGSTVDPSFIGGATSPNAVAVDAGYVFWANFAGPNTIGRANLDGTAANQNFITGAAAPAGLAVNAAYIYWSNYGADTIGRANLDGTGVDQNFITGASLPAGIAVDSAHVYWVNQATGAIGRANLDGTSVNQNSIPGANAGNGLAIEGQFVYWVTRDKTGSPENTIGRANLDATGVNPSFIIGATLPAGLAVDAGEPPVNVADPSVSGVPSPNQTLSEVRGSWLYGPTLFADQWLRCDATGISCAPIPGASGQTYALSTSDRGFTFRVQETASNTYGSSVPATSPATSVVAPPLGASLSALSTLGATASVSITCDGPSGAACTGGAVLTARERTRGRMIVGVSARRRRGPPKASAVTVTVGRGSVAVPVGQQTTLRIALNKTGRRLLSTLYKLPARLSVTGIPTRTITFAYPVLNLPIRYTAAYHQAYTVTLAFSVSDLPARSEVRLTCKGPGCPFTAHTIRPSHARVNLTSLFGGAHLLPGAVVGIVVTAPDEVGEVKVIRVRAGAGPQQTDLCQAPGITNPQPCHH